MSIKKILKYLILGILGLLVGKILMQELFDHRPFKFEQYKTTEELEAAATFKYLPGTVLDKIITDLERSGAECHTFKSKQEPFGPPKTYETITECGYITSLLSLHPFEYYIIGLLCDKEQKLVGIEAQRISGLMLYIP